MTESYKRYLPLDALRILFPSTLRRALPLRQIPSWYSGIQPIQNCVEHFSITSSGPPSLRLLFRRQQILAPIPLFFADFMSFHALHFISSALYTQSLSFKTDFRTWAETASVLMGPRHATLPVWFPFRISREVIGCPSLVITPPFSSY